jgi:hypothetical protein
VDHREATPDFPKGEHLDDGVDRLTLSARRPAIAARWPIRCRDRSCRALPVGLPQHPDEHGPERPVFFAVDQQLGEGSALQVAPELSDPVGSLEVGEHKDVEQLGAGSGAEGVEAFPESSFEVIWAHGGD